MIYLTYVLLLMFTTELVFFELWYFARQLALIETSEI